MLKILCAGFGVSVDMYGFYGEGWVITVLR